MVFLVFLIPVCDTVCMVYVCLKVPLVVLGVSVSPGSLQCQGIVCFGGCVYPFFHFLLSDMGIVVRIVQKDPPASDVWLGCRAIVHRLGVLLPCGILPHKFLCFFCLL